MGTDTITVTDDDLARARVRILCSGRTGDVASTYGHRTADGQYVCESLDVLCDHPDGRGHLTATDLGRDDVEVIHLYPTDDDA